MIECVAGHQSGSSLAIPYHITGRWIIRNTSGIPDNIAAIVTTIKIVNIQLEK